MNSIQGQQLARAESFHALHSASAIFVMPCAWDAFSAMLFERAGFSCIGTTSGGVNWINGRRDYVYSTPRKSMLESYGDISRATRLPVSGDLENGYGEYPEHVEQTVADSIKYGMVGGSIEDQKVVPSAEDSCSGELFPLDQAVERIQSARAAANTADFPYTLTARCEVYYTDCQDPYGVAVKRLNAYREAGADCLFVPGLNDLALLQQLVREVDGPINFGMGATPEPITLSMLEDAGVLRVSTGGGLTRAAFGFLDNAIGRLATRDSFAYLNTALSENEVNRILSDEKP